MVKPVVYGINTDEVTIEWIKSKMKEYGVKKNDFVKQIAIDKSSLDLILFSDKEPSKTVKALFYYFFLTLQINRDFRNDENFIESDKSQ
jgi:predicted transcriptional regulator